MIVCGTRYYNDRAYFHEKILDYLEEFEGPVLFVSGDASTGADYLIIRWCLKFKYPCLKMPANWDNEGKAAGFLRNIRMAKVATHVLAFYDGDSSGTKHMLEQADEHKLHEKIYIIKVDSNGTTDNKKAVPSV